MKPSYTLLLSSARTRWVAFALPVLAVVVIALHLVWLRSAHEQLRADTLAQAGHHAEQLAEAKAGQVESLIGGVDVVLRQVRDQYATGNTQATAAAIRSAFDALPQGAVLHFAVSDAQGTLVFSTVAGAQGVQVADRDYFKFHSRSVPILHGDDV